MLVEELAVKLNVIGGSVGTGNNKLFGKVTNSLELTRRETVIVTY